MSEENNEVRNNILNNITDISNNVNNLNFVLLGYITFRIITIFSVTDSQLILNQLKVTLPIVNANVNIQAFFISAPIGSIIIYLYFSIYLIRLKTLKDRLKTEFPDYDLQFLSPWILNIIEKPDIGFGGKLQLFTARLMQWWALPIFFEFICLKYIKTHNLFWSIDQALHDKEIGRLL